MQFFPESGKPFGLIFKVDIKQKYEIPTAMIQPCKDGLVVSEVPGQVYDDDAIVLCPQRQRLRQRVVGRTVIDQHDLVVIADLGLGCRGSTRAEFLDIGGRTVEGGNDRKFHGRERRSWLLC